MVALGSAGVCAMFLFVVLPLFKFTLYNRLCTQPAPPRAWRSVPMLRTR